MVNIKQPTPHHTLIILENSLVEIGLAFIVVGDISNPLFRVVFSEAILVTNFDLGGTHDLVLDANSSRVPFLVWLIARDLIFLAYAFITTTACPRYSPLVSIHTTVTASRIRTLFPQLLIYYELENNSLLCPFFKCKNLEIIISTFFDLFLILATGQTCCLHDASLEGFTLTTSVMVESHKSRSSAATDSLCCLAGASLKGFNLQLQIQLNLTKVINKRQLSIQFQSVFQHVVH